MIKETNIGGFLLSAERSKLVGVRSDEQKKFHHNVYLAWEQTGKRIINNTENLLGT